MEVLTDGGDRVGQNVDADLDDSSLAVKAYVPRNASGAWRRRGRIHPSEVVTCSPELMLIRGTEAETAATTALAVSRSSAMTIRTSLP